GVSHLCPSEAQPAQLFQRSDFFYPIISDRKLPETQVFEPAKPGEFLQPGVRNSRPEEVQLAELLQAGEGLQPGVGDPRTAQVQFTELREGRHVLQIRVRNGPVLKIDHDDRGARSVLLPPDLGPKFFQGRDRASFVSSRNT